MERGDMRDRVRRLLRLDEDDTNLDDDLDIYLDEGYDEVVAFKDWPWTIQNTPTEVTLIPDVNYYATADTLKRIISIGYDDQDYPLEYMSPVDFIRTEATSTSTTSTPTHFTYLNKELKIWPTPAAAGTLSVWHTTHPVFGAAEDDEPVFDEAYHMILVDWCLSRMWEQEEDFDRSDMYMGRFASKLDRMRVFYNDEIELRPAVYGGGSMNPVATNTPWLSDANNGGAT